MEWPDHVAGVLALTRHFGIEDEDALSGMLAAPPDPFATRLVPVGDVVDPAMFVNAFPANDPRSTLGVWHHVRERGYPSEGLVVIMNCRDDRIDRTRRFARSVLPELPIDTLVITGAATRAVTDAVEEGRIGEILNFRGTYLQDWSADPDAPLSWRFQKKVAGSGARVVEGDARLSDAL
jgi:hypothetical protein